MIIRRSSAAILLLLFFSCHFLALADDLPTNANSAVIEKTVPDKSLDEQPSDQSPEEKAEEKKAKSNPLFKRLLKKVSFFKLQYYFVAQNAANCDLFYGMVVDNPLIGRATVTFTFPNGCNCHGVAQVTHYPLFGGAAGQRGYINAKCTDGRKMKGRFTTTSLTTGNGTVTDSLGNQYQFTFGHTAEEAVSRVNTLRRELGCPEFTAKEIELKVHAQILKKDHD